MANKKEILAEDFINARREYDSFCNAMWELWDDDPIMTCLLSKLHDSAEAYYKTLINIYRNGMTVDEVVGLIGIGKDENPKI